MPHKAKFFKPESLMRDYLAKSDALKGAGIEISFEDAVLNKGNIPADKDFDIAGVFVDSLVDKEVLDKLPNIKFIAALSTGFDHIDTGECKKRGIMVSYVPSYGENTVAEFTFGLILALSRKICEAHCRVKEEGNFNLEGLRGFDLKSRTLGVVGTGRIGKHVVRIANGFEMNVVAYDVIKDEKFAAEMGFKYLPLEELLKTSDIVTLHVPYMESTHHLINSDTIKFMKPGAYFINTSRGAVVETDALALALKDGRLGGAGLDVLEEEGIMKDELNILAGERPDGEKLKTALENRALIDMPNVIITPHNAFNSVEGLQRILDTTIENVGGFISGKLVNLVP
jgi:D-lactate dehydrogenase